MLFNLLASGSGSVGTDLWVNLGAIPLAQNLWIGTMVLTSTNKTVLFELRTNKVGQSVGTLAATTLLSSASLRAGTSVTQDLYRKGRLHTVTVVSTGSERWWLHLTSKGATAGSFLYKIMYAVE